MIFNYALGLKEVDKKMNVNYRKAIRAVVFQNGKILMVGTNKCDYKFPGGGVENDESHEETLKREVREETGYIVKDIKNRIGVITQRKMDDYDVNSVFEMVSYYYLCEISDEQTALNLDDYEAELGFYPVWIDINRAIQSNEENFKKSEDDRNSWLQRETIVLKELLKYHDTI
ncbi:NUDIX hydrolase [Abyssisolibacter fermentans]|uniref:NUDIX hydrolase n=1 Tax=Abyssisolibacter fermentans TaxID=1766203 RepID=UPI000835B0D9|nr:NUDIX domain-containing protein [Abyssisolibacter fermentans]